MFGLQQCKLWLVTSFCWQHVFVLSKYAYTTGFIKLGPGQLKWGKKALRLNIKVRSKQVEVPGEAVNGQVWRGQRTPLSSDASRCKGELVFMRNVFEHSSLG